MKALLMEGARRARRDQMIAAAVSGLLHSPVAKQYNFENATARVEFADLATSLGIDIALAIDQKERDGFDRTPEHGGRL